MKTFLVAQILAFAFAAHAAPPAGYTLAWADEFNGTSLNQTNWSHWLPGARRSAVNSPAAVTVANGLLTLTTFTEGGTNFTGMICTERKFQPTYGYCEARMAFADAPATWSAFWLQPPGMGRILGDPAHGGVEIDVVEHRPLDKDGANISRQSVVNLHWDGYGRRHKNIGSKLFGAKLNEGFHLYAVEWTPSKLEFFVDDKSVWNTTNPVPQRDEFLIFSSEVEDHGWAGNIPAGGYGDRTASSNRLQVDYLRVYQCTNVVAPAEELDAWEPLAAYESRELLGWKILVNRQLVAETNLCTRTLRQLEAQLYAITRVVRAEPLAQLRQIPIWIERSDKLFPCMCAHESAEWLRAHDVNPAKTGGVELANPENFLTWTREQPWMVLHELAHGYHHRFLGDDHAGIRAAFERAKAAGIYEKVLRASGKMERHYALTNPKEFFAEATEAYFGVNDFYPFVRAELSAHDPQTFALLREIWGDAR